MPRLLFLAHRIPFPPDKGEKIRAFHILKHLARRFEVECGCLVDDPADEAHIATLCRQVAHLEAQRITGPGRMMQALVQLRPGRPLTHGWFREPRLLRWVAHGLGSGRYDAVFVSSSGMAPYVMGQPRHPARQRRVLDLIDVDSEKFAAYAATGSLPMRLVHGREARTLLGLERRAAAAFDHTLLVSAAEAARLAALAPEIAGRIGHLENGVDFARFDPGKPWPSPYTAPGQKIVFTGAMGYPPNIEAVTWFAQQVLPRLRQRSPPPEFVIVGQNPAPSVRALEALPGVRVTGTVAEVQPWLAHAAVAVAPLTLARGIQNKVLEAMAMARPVVATTEAFQGVHATPGRDLLVADGADAFAAAVAAVLDGRHQGIGVAARAAVLAGHDWAATLAPLDRLLAIDG
ncbi:MAG: TIGR03087 family PEP-CTERM/XrtA system glycosyltransferase [Acetobacteraceae bacterium]|nr:TIGR03087 family PEP-CTERM/XrtA system glycosyltransferase [Acetobacteraceae bacterium]